MNEFYVYQYIGVDGVPYYIGKGKGKRIKEGHPRTVVPSEEFRVFIQTDMTESDALVLENRLIRKYGRKIDGGLLDNTKLNQWACTSGWKHKEQTKKKISKTTTGVSKSEKHKANMRKPKSDSHKENIRKANLGRVDSEERREKNRQGALKLEVREAKSKKMKELIAAKKLAGVSWGRKRSSI